MPVPVSFDSQVVRSVRLQRNRTWRAPIMGVLAEEMSCPVGMKAGLSMLRRYVLRDLEHVHHMDGVENMKGRPR